MDIYISESREQRKARYSKMAIAAAAAAARAKSGEVRLAYLLMAESWSRLAKREDRTSEQAQDASTPATPDLTGQRSDLEG